MPPSADAQRMKRSPKTRTSSFMILNPNARHVPLGGALRIGCLEVDVIDPVRHASLHDPTGRVSGWLDKSPLRGQYRRPGGLHDSRVRLRSRHRSAVHREQQVAEVRQGRAAAVGRRHGLRVPRAGGARASRARRARRVRLRVRGAGARGGGRGAHRAPLRLAGGAGVGGAAARRDRGLQHGRAHAHDAGRRAARAAARLSADPPLPRQHGAHRATRRSLARRADGRYELDVEAFERAITPRTRAFLLCNPHNPDRPRLFA